ncbi:MAG: alpha/beta hydrolase fold domain-containing protein [Alphaproteobacteria bacterium]|nr:alpha/beta hydrolase fold domain-containing protein [Alphaproteobacteria bacterium]
MTRIFAAALLPVLLALPLAARGQDKPAPATPDLPPRVETRHTLTVTDHNLDYRAIAETLPLTDAKGEPTATVYTISYIADPGPGQRRPVAFVFNGGPGAASVFLHLGALGPRILQTPASGAVPAPPYRLVDNPSTWLVFTDLVFIDPVGTGYSRGAGKGDNPDKPFWDVRADLRSLGAVVRLWLTRHQRWDSPVFLAGESYGGFRAAAMAHTLARDVGIAVNAIVLISPALDLSVLHHGERDLVAAAVPLPSYAAAAGIASGRGDGDGAAVERFALSDYLVGLAGLKGEPPAGDPFIARVAAIVGLREEVVRRHRGRIPGGVFAREILREQGKLVSLYDATIARPAAEGDRDEAGDPVLDPAVAAYTAAFENYAPEALGYHTDQPYRVLPRDVSQQWNWEGAEDRGGLGFALESLQSALLEHGEMKVLVVNGRYDLVTPYLGTRWLIDQLSIPAAIRDGIRLEVLPGGHMMYMRPESRAVLAQDAAALFAPVNAAPSQ